MRKRGSIREHFLETKGNSTGFATGYQPNPEAYVAPIWMRLLTQYPREPSV
jgi:hypothetical protein